MGKPKILELDLVRAAAILAVLLIHATAQATVDIPPGSRSQIFYLAINKFSHFAVPVFILLSGIVLFYSYADRWNLKESMSFYRKRLQFVLVPYVLWSVFYYLYNKWVVHFDISRVNTEPAKFFFEILPWGSAQYHLYFIIIIAQMYLLFPVLLTLSTKWPWFGRNLIWLGIAVQIFFYIYHSHVDAFVHRDRLWFNYIGLFCIGGYLGLNYEKIRNGERHLWWVIALTLSAGFLFFLIFVLALMRISLGGYFYEIIFNLYAVGIAVSFLWIARKITRGMPRLTSFFTALGAASFGIYLIHPAVLTLLQTHIIFPVGSFYYHALIFAAFLLTLAVPWAITWLFKHWKSSWIVLGR